VSAEGVEDDVTGVGVRVEVDHRDPPVAEVPCHTGRIRESHRVVAAEHRRHRTSRGDGVHSVL
jgi:hypothetical protein